MKDNLVGISKVKMVVKARVAIACVRHLVGDNQRVSRCTTDAMARSPQ